MSCGKAYAAFCRRAAWPPNEIRKNTMTELAKKIEPAAKNDPALKVVTAKEKPTKKRFARLESKRARFTLMVVVPAIALVIGLGIYLMGGRYISTDNAYVGAQ